MHRTLERRAERAGEDDGRLEISSSSRPNTQASPACPTYPTDTVFVNVVSNDPIHPFAQTAFGFSRPCMQVGQTVSAAGVGDRAEQS